MLKYCWLLCSVLLLLTQPFVWSCGYDTCPTYKRDALNVHLVPHSHDDVGWLKTVDQYYYGSKSIIQLAGVQYILDSVIEELLKDPIRRFIYVEAEFFMKWWSEQTSETREHVRTLLRQGRLEIAGGGWSMNDEAATHYQSIIDQFTLGLRALKEEVHSCARPKVGWQIDPFGHSREMASLFAQMGFDGEFFARVTWHDKNDRLLTKTAEMIWQADENLGEASDLFAGILRNHYSAPPGFCFDILCIDEPFMDAAESENNVERKVEAFLTYIANMSAFYQASHLLVPMGDDFNYMNAHMNFKNIDKLIKYVNRRQSTGSKVNVFYSTPACYLKALHESNLTWPIKTDDFFPYATDFHTYWTGYYSSRPTHKRFERLGNHMLQTVKQLAVFSQLNTTVSNLALNQLREAMGILQHHDAITGTERQLVAFDYARLLTSAMNSASQHLLAPALRKMSNYQQGEFISCLQLNISYCEFTDDMTHSFLVTLYNPSSTSNVQYVRLPVPAGNYEVLNKNGQRISSQLLVVPREVLQLTNRATNSTYEVVFQSKVDRIDNYVIRALKQDFKSIAATRPTSSFKLWNSLVALKFNEFGKLEELTVNGVKCKVAQNFFYYKSAAGNNQVFENRSSGAYIFRPNGTLVEITEKATLTVYEGELVKEVHQKFNEWLSQVIRIYEGQTRVEFEWLVGPIPIEDGVGKEIITKISTDIANKNIFWTDTNGRGLIRRQRSFADYNDLEKEASNYYPVTTRIAIEDEHKRIALLTDRAQGGSSLQEGELELMLHRRILRDDAFGVGEALNETFNNKGLVARGKLWLLLQSTGVDATKEERVLEQEMLLPYWLSFSSYNNVVPTINYDFSSFTNLPKGIQILNLEPFSNNEILLRLENTLTRKETDMQTINIYELFKALGGEQIQETTLDGNLLLKDMQRLKFPTDVDSDRPAPLFRPLLAKRENVRDKFDVTLNPKQIRTFIISYTAKQNTFQ